MKQRKPSRLVRNWYRRDVRIARKLEIKPPPPLKKWARAHAASDGKFAKVCQEWLFNKGLAA
jgi:hypothetical protein